MSNTSCAASCLPNHNKSNSNKLEEESDEDLFRVPDMDQLEPLSISNQKRRRGRNPVDKEYKRLKRLLRNRVSAQQARERKKVYVSDLESRAKQLEDINSELEQNISTLINENTMLRKVLMNTRPKDDQSIEPKSDFLSKH